MSDAQNKTDALSSVRFQFWLLTLLPAARLPAAVPTALTHPARRDAAMPAACVDHVRFDRRRFQAGEEARIRRRCGSSQGNCAGSCEREREVFHEGSSVKCTEINPARVIRSRFHPSMSHFFCKKILGRQNFRAREFHSEHAFSEKWQFAFECRIIGAT